MSAQQQDLIHLLRKGYGFRIIRSTITLMPAFCALSLPGKQSCIAEIPWWRIEQLLETGGARLNNRNPSAATEILLTDRGMDGGTRTKSGGEGVSCAPESVARFDFQPLEDYWLAPEILPPRVPGLESERHERQDKRS